MPWKITPVRNSLAEEGIFSGINDLKLILFRMIVYP
jgi:hypothetical protein